MVVLLLFGMSLECSFTLAGSRVIPIGAVNITPDSGWVYLTSFHIFNHGPTKTTVQFRLFNNAGTDVTGEIYDSRDPSREIESNQSWIVDVPRGPDEPGSLRDFWILLTCPDDAVIEATYDVRALAWPTPGSSSLSGIPPESKMGFQAETPRLEWRTSFLIASAGPSLRDVSRDTAFAVVNPSPDETATVTIRWANHFDPPPTNGNASLQIPPRGRVVSLMTLMFPEAIPDPISTPHRDAWGWLEFSGDIGIVVAPVEVYLPNGEFANGGLVSPVAGDETREYKIGEYFPSPPWDVGPLEGVSFDILTATCEANAPMKCQFEVLSAQDCFDTDDEGNPKVGHALASGQVDGCPTWFATPERRRLGAEFGHGYSSGPTPQLIASNDDMVFDDLGAEGSLGGAVVGFIAGFFSDPACLGTRYSDFEPVFFPSDQAGQGAMVAALLTGSIDLGFWNHVGTLPDRAHLVGEPIRTCGPDLSLAVFPPSTSRKHKSDELKRDYNCGLALIRASGVLEQICVNSPHPGGDPACIFEGPPPTVQCLADNPPQP